MNKQNDTIEQKRAESFLALCTKHGGTSKGPLEAKTKLDHMVNKNHPFLEATRLSVFHEASEKKYNICKYPEVEFVKALFGIDHDEEASGNGAVHQCLEDGRVNGQPCAFYFQPGQRHVAREQREQVVV